MDDMDSDKTHRLLVMLREDTESLEEADDLLATIRKLRRWTAPIPDKASTDRLLQTLLAELPNRRTRPFMQPILLMCAQLWVVKREIWAASLLVILLGTLVTLITYQPAVSVEMLPIVWTAPLGAAIGIAFLYGTDEQQMFEIEEATATSTRLILVIRLVMVFGFDLVLGVLASVVLALTQSSLSAWPLVLTWLAPMAFLSALAFLLSVYFVDPAVGTLAAMGLWAFHTMVRFLEQSSPSTLTTTIPNLLSPGARPGLLLATLLFGILAIWLAGQERQRR